MSAASKLAAMAKVLETPVKGKPGRNYCLQSENCLFLLFQSEISADRSVVCVSTDSCPVVNQAGLSNNQPEQPSAPPEHRPKPTAAPGKEASSGNPPPFHHKQSQQAAAPLGPEKRGRVQKPAVDGGAHNRPVSEKLNSPFLVQDAPVRDEKGTGWSATSSDSDAGFQPARLSHPGRKVEPVKPFSVAVLSEEFGHLHPDFSDMTVYNDIAQMTPGGQTKALSCREPTPGSEAERQQEPGPRALFSELRQHHQDSGFGSPFYHQK